MLAWVCAIRFSPLLYVSSTHTVPQCGLTAPSCTCDEKKNKTPIASLSNLIRNVVRHKDHTFQITTLDLIMRQNIWLERLVIQKNGHLNLRSFTDKRARPYLQATWWLRTGWSSGWKACRKYGMHVEKTQPSLNGGDANLLVEVFSALPSRHGALFLFLLDAICIWSQCLLSPYSLSDRYIRSLDLHCGQMPTGYPGRSSVLNSAQTPLGFGVETFGCAPPFT